MGYVRRAVTERTIAALAASGLSAVVGCLERESEQLVITDTSMTPRHEERTVLLSGTVENESSEERSGTVVGEVTITETGDEFTDSKDVSLDGGDSTRFELRIPVQSPEERLSFSYSLDIE